MNRKPYPSDVSDDEWAFVAPYLTLISTVESSSKYLILEAFGNAAFFIAHFLKAFIFNGLEI